VNLACFPVQYQETYYKDVVEKHDEGLCKFAYYNGFVVGAACSRLEDIPNVEDDKTDNTDDSNNKSNSSNNKNTSNKKRIYIMTLGVLAAYRGRQIGTQLIQSILDHYESQKENEYKDVTEIVLHVQVSNEDAIKFYTTRFGFEQGEMVENYYRRIDPPHCYKLYKTLR
jgi:ribosomal protein S18 acetylase RimI-like enzyme